MTLEPSVEPLAAQSDIPQNLDSELMDGLEPSPDDEPFVWDAENVAVIGSLGAVLYQRGDHRRAAAVFQALAQLAPDNADVFAALGAVQLAQRKLDEAIKNLDEAIRLNDQLIEAYVSRAEVLIRLERYEEALADIRRVLELDPERKTQAAQRAELFALGLEKTFERLRKRNTTATLT